MLLAGVRVCVLQQGYRTVLDIQVATDLDRELKVSVRADVHRLDCRAALYSLYRIS